MVLRVRRTLVSLALKFLVWRRLEFLMLGLNCDVKVDMTVLVTLGPVPSVLVMHTRSHGTFVRRRQWDTLCSYAIRR